MLTLRGFYYNNHYAAWSRQQLEDFLDELEEVIQLRRATGTSLAHDPRTMRTTPTAASCFAQTQKLRAASTSSQRLAGAMMGALRGAQSPPSSPRS
ncbi:MAG: hypothetical protein U0326_31070 [Polyangiales bacterium]